MIPQYELTMDNKDKSDPIVTVRVVVEGLTRTQSVVLAEQTFPNYSIRYVIAGHKQEDS